MYYIITDFNKYHSLDIFTFSIYYVFDILQYFTIKIFIKIFIQFSNSHDHASKSFTFSLYSLFITNVFWLQKFSFETKTRPTKDGLFYLISLSFELSWISLVKFLNKRIFPKNHVTERKQFYILLNSLSININKNEWILSVRY